jgi:HEPN domain-containing protein
MDESKIWLAKAADDIRWTESSIIGDIWYGACFTAHQAVEKSLKAFLIFNNQEIKKIHDLRVLLEQCSDIDSSLVTLKEDIVNISPYYIGTRYPIFEEFSIFSENQAKEALVTAKKVFQIISDLLY